MKKLTLLIGTIFLIGACSQDEQNTNLTPSQPMVEYVWMTVGPEFSVDNLASVISSWNQMIDDMGCNVNANILTPELPSEGFDFVYGLIYGNLKLLETNAGTTGVKIIKLIMISQLKE